MRIEENCEVRLRSYITIIPFPAEARRGAVDAQGSVNLDFVRGQMAGCEEETWNTSRELRDRQPEQSAFRPRFKRMRDSTYKPSSEARPDNPDSRKPCKQVCAAPTVAQAFNFRSIK